MRVLIGCATSCVALEAFLARGHDAWQCDIEPAERQTNRHIQDDIRNVIGWGWDLLILSNPPCFVGDTLVLTSEGYKPIRDVCVGDEVLTHKGRWRRVREVMSKTTTCLTRLKSTNGLETYTTPEHPYYARYREPYRTGFRTKAERDRLPEFVPADNLTTRHFTGSVLPPIHPVEICDDDLWLMGRYVADGHMRESRRAAGKYEEMVISIGPEKLSAFKERVTRKASYSEAKTAVRATFYGHDTIAIFAQFGRGAANKALPGWVLSLPVEQARIFLDGYLSGDGYAREKSISASTVSTKLALGVALLMQRVFKKCPALRTSAPRPLVTIEGREVETLPLHHVEVTRSDKRLRNYVADDYAWGHVREVATVTRGALVFNLSVEEDETYTANGLVVHNCTRLCNSGVRWLHEPPPTAPREASDYERDLWPDLSRDERLAIMWRLLDEGAALFSDCWNAPIPCIAVENPVMHKHAKARIDGYQPFAQSVHPWHFATSEDGPDNVKKRTCLWLKNLPALIRTGTVDGSTARPEIHHASPGEDRARIRSRTFPGMAAAWADQWGAAALDAIRRAA